MNENENTQQPVAETSTAQVQEQPSENLSHMPETQSAPDPTPFDAELQHLIAEAEQRGYMRGRNEAIEKLMQAPALFNGGELDNTVAGNPDAAEGFLSGLRPGVWD